MNTVPEEISNQQGFPLARYRQLAELRFHIRRYLQFSEQVARAHGIEPQQHQLMITIKGLPASTVPTVSALANRLCLRHHSTVELINRLVERGAAVRKPSKVDRRQVLVELTPQGEELLEKLNAEHNQELQTCAPELISVLTTTMHTPDNAEIGENIPNGHGENIHNPENNYFKTAAGSDMEVS
jgi:DNA-binding MarR family transcriptional regulator